MRVKIVVLDIDDNSPAFLQRGNATTGVRVNAPLYTVIETLTAVDADVDSSAVFYQVCTWLDSDLNDPIPLIFSIS